METDFYFDHLEVNNKPVQFVLVTDRYVVDYYFLILQCELYYVHLLGVFY